MCTLLRCSDTFCFNNSSYKHQKGDVNSCTVVSCHKFNERNHEKRKEKRTNIISRRYVTCLKDYGLMGT